MLLTTELRWFCPGVLPSAGRDWFQQDALGQYLGSPESRKDQYLYIPACEYLNVKSRQGKLEVKLRQAERGILPLGHHSGQVESWAKWRCDASQEGNWLEDAEGPWVEVEKVRSQRQYQILPNQAPIAIPTDSTVEEGCRVELTGLMIQDSTWWSLAFEAFGTPVHQLAHLQRVANWIMQSHQPEKIELEVVLQVQHSYAYPKWLLATLG